MNPQQLRQRALGARNGADPRRRLQHQHRDASMRRRGRATGITWSAARSPAILSDRASNVIRVGRIGEELGTGAQTFFDDDVNADRLRRPRSVLDRAAERCTRATSPARAAKAEHRDPHLHVRRIVQLLRAQPVGGEHTFKSAAASASTRCRPRTTFSSGTFQFRHRRAVQPGRSGDLSRSSSTSPSVRRTRSATTSPRRIAGTTSSPKTSGGSATTLTLNLGVRYDHQQPRPRSNGHFAPRAGFAWDVTGAGQHRGARRHRQVLRLHADLLDLAHQRGVLTLFPAITVTGATTLAARPAAGHDQRIRAGNPGVALLSPRARRSSSAPRPDPRGNDLQPQSALDSPDRQLPYQWSWSIGVSHQLFSNTAVARRLRRQRLPRSARRHRHQRAGQPRAARGRRVRSDGALIPRRRAARPSRASCRCRRARVRRRLQVAAVLVHQADGQPLERPHRLHRCRRATTSALGNPDARRVWLDNDIRADYGRFASDRRHVLAVSATFNVGGRSTSPPCISAISGSPINETVGRDVNGDSDNNDRPIRGIDDLAFPIRSESTRRGAR